MGRIWRHDLLLLLSLCVLVLTTSCSACRRSTTPANSNTSISTGPPFVAKEPGQYRAIRVTTYAGAEPRQTGIARDGDRSRIDFTRDGKPVTLIETPAGRVLISNDRAVFSRLQPDEAAVLPSDDQALTPDLSTDRLLHQTDLRTEYRRLRADQIGSRTVTVYQVTIGTSEALTESELWIDDETGFPLKNVLTPIAGGVRQPNGYVTEIRDLIIGPPPANWFEIPPHYREVPLTQFWAPGN